MLSEGKEYLRRVWAVYSIVNTEDGTLRHMYYDHSYPGGCMSRYVRHYIANFRQNWQIPITSILTVILRKLFCSHWNIYFCCPGFPRTICKCWDILIYAWNVPVLHIYTRLQVARRVGKTPSTAKTMEATPSMVQKWKRRWPSQQPNMHFRSKLWYFPAYICLKNDKFV